MVSEMTRKALYAEYGKENVIIIPGYMVNVPSKFNRSAYCAGVYGWNCDVYKGRHYAYTFGDRPYGCKSSIATERSMINTMKADGVWES